MEISQISWGDDSAEKDTHLLKYFVSSDSFRRLAERTKSIVIGRKGAGKSALLTKLSQVFEGEGSHVIRLAPKYNSIRTILNDVDLANGFGQEIFFQHTWLRQIYLDVLCSIGHESKGGLSSGSMEFARSVAVQQNRTSKDLVENIADILGRVKVKVGELGEFGLQLENELRSVAEVDSLEHHVLQLLQEGIKVVVMVDDLDLGWDNSSTANNMLLGLLSAVSYIGALSDGLHPVVFLREDVYSILLGKTQHSDKYRNVERLRWSQDALVEMLEARINFNREQDGLRAEDDVFYSVFPRQVGTTNSNNWLIERTLSRPRELIQLARYYTEAVDGDLPSDQALKSSENDYSNWKLEDLCAEYSNQYPEMNTVFSYWKTKFFRQKYHLKYVEVEEILLSILSDAAINREWFNKLANDVDVSGFLKILYEVGFVGDFVLGGSGGSKTYYSYEGRHEPLFDEVQIHPCFRKAVNTVERIRTREALQAQ
ncbi:P-loop ATPase, Sll1717 family [Pseudomonas sp. TH10]|uniref:P-loop ATPase, Sll1717 family n=1 Tax=Pseudomonas sp. TH10 TaxID=2796376 RepID=UPI00191329B7|nr:hypothetical protein [Pseudomonas sp. TH10]MBK5516783.1 hypothetical protein [Pseudomonas sp. TH10]